MRTVRTVVGLLAMMAAVLAVATPANASGGGGFNNAPGTVHVRSVRSGLCIDPLTESLDPVVLIQYTCRNAKSQEWEWLGPVLYATNGAPVYLWRNNNSKLCMNSPDGFGTNGSKVDQETCSTSLENDMWELYSNSAGHVFFRNFGNHKCLDLENGDPTVGVEMQVWDCNFNTANQMWDLA